MIIRGKWNYWGDAGNNAPWILDQQGADSPVPFSIAQWVPANALRIEVECVMMSVWARSDGYIDCTAHLGVDPSGSDFGTMCVAAGNFAPGVRFDFPGRCKTMPNVNQTLYFWLSGQSLQVGCNMTIALLGYETP